VHQANERVLCTSNKIAQKTSSFDFTYYIIIIAIYKHNISARDKVFHNSSYFLQESTNSSKSSRAKLLRVVQLESMPGYKYPNIDSGATPIRSAGRAPDRKLISRKSSTRRTRREEEEEDIGAYDRLQVSNHSLRGYSHRERWARTRRCFFMNITEMKVREASGIIITYRERVFIDQGCINPNIFSQTLTAT
jgi:hypothetical protein